MNHTITFTRFYTLLLLLFIMSSCGGQNEISTDSKLDCMAESDKDSYKNLSNDQVPYDVLLNYPYLSITTEALGKAKNLSDLNSNFKTSWIKSYISVEISVRKNGNQKTVKGFGYKLSEEQKHLVINADTGSDILVKVTYNPENNLSYNEPKTINFMVKTMPELNASYPGGYSQLLAYFKANAIDKIPAGTYEGYDMTAITFIVNESGEITNLELVEPFFNNENIKALLMNAISKMPMWNPAKYKDGTAVAQEFALIVGNMDNCTLHLLKLHKD